VQIVRKYDPGPMYVADGRRRGWHRMGDLTMQSADRNSPDHRRNYFAPGLIPVLT